MFVKKLLINLPKQFIIKEKQYKKKKNLKKLNLKISLDMVSRKKSLLKYLNAPKKTKKIWSKMGKKKDFRSINSRNLIIKKIKRRWTHRKYYKRFFNSNGAV